MIVSQIPSSFVGRVTRFNWLLICEQMPCTFDLNRLGCRILNHFIRTVVFRTNRTFLPKDIQELTLKPWEVVKRHSGFRAAHTVRLVRYSPAESPDFLVLGSLQGNALLVGVYKSWKVPQSVFLKTSILQSHSSRVYGLYQVYIKTARIPSLIERT